MDGSVLCIQTPTLLREKEIHRNIDFHFPPHRSKRSVLCYVPGNSVCGGERECGEVQGGDGWQYRVF